MVLATQRVGDDTPGAEAANGGEDDSLRRTRRRRWIVAGFGLLVVIAWLALDLPMVDVFALKGGNSQGLGIAGALLQLVFMSLMLFRLGRKFGRMGRKMGRARGYFFPGPDVPRRARRRKKGQGVTPVEGSTVGPEAPATQVVSDEQVATNRQEGLPEARRRTPGPPLGGGRPTV